MSAERTLSALLGDAGLGAFELLAPPGREAPDPDWVLEAPSLAEAGEARAGDLVVAGAGVDPTALASICAERRATALVVPSGFPTALGMAAPGSEGAAPGLVAYPAWLPRHAAALAVARALWPARGQARGQGESPVARLVSPRRRAIAVRRGGREPSDLAEIAALLDAYLPRGVEALPISSAPGGERFLTLAIKESVAPKELRNALRDAASELGLSIGASDAFERGSDERAYLERAREALVLGTALLGNGHVSFYENLYLYKAFVDDGRPDILLYFSRDTLNRLKEWDVAQGSSLLETLEAYFEHDRNVGRTASRLGIHRHTLKNRLEKIEEVTSYPVRGEWAMSYELMLAYKHLSKVKL